MRRIVVCAAVKNYHNGMIVCGARHFDTAMQSVLLSIDSDTPWNKNWEQGFIDQDGEFLTREQAAEIAYEAGQTGRKLSLFSEDLY